MGLRPTPAFVTRTVKASDLHLRVILDLNLVTGIPPLLKAGMEEAQKVLPEGSVSGYEVGNEPDLYNRRFWLRPTHPFRPHEVALQRDHAANIRRRL